MIKRKYKQNSLFVSSKILLAIALTACVSDHQKSLNAKNINLEDSKKIIALPTKVDEKPPLLEKDSWKNIKIEKNLVPFYRISRKKAEVRKGPSVNFNIEDQFLKNDDLVFILESYSQWRKIYAPIKKIIGWVHFKALEADDSNKNTVLADITYFPLVFAKNQVAKVYDFETKKALNLKVDKGTSFYALHKKGKMILVYDRQTNQMAWLEAKDFI